MMLVMLGPVPRWDASLIDKLIFVVVVAALIVAGVRFNRSK